jgi:hypothetical protein
MMKKALLAAVVAFMALGVGAASAQVVSVSAKSLPWSEVVNFNDYYGWTCISCNNGNGSKDLGGVNPYNWVAPTVVSLSAGMASVTIDYQSSTAVLDGYAFDAAGVAQLTYANYPAMADGYQINNPAVRAPSYYTAASPKGLYGALIVSFADSNGVIVGTPFEPGDSSDTVAIPTGASELLLGLNEANLFTSNGATSGSLMIDVTQNANGVGGGVPEAPTYWMALLGVLALGALGARRMSA